MDYHVSVFWPAGTDSGPGKDPARPATAIVRELRPHFPDSPEGRDGLRPSGLYRLAQWALRLRLLQIAHYDSPIQQLLGSGW
jgi:hypothetical protein